MANFTYFDQYGDIEIDLTDYLLRMSAATSASKYKYNFSNMQPVKTTVSNLFTKYDVVLNFKKNMDVLVYYNVIENETIEQVSFKNYNTIDYWWIIAIFNDIFNPFTDWPLNQEQLINAVDLLYENEGLYSRNAYYNFLFEKNEDRRQLILPELFVIPDIIWTYREAILNG